MHRVPIFRPDPVTQIPVAPNIPPHAVNNVVERLSFYSALTPSDQVVRRREFAASIVEATLALSKEHS